MTNEQMNEIFNKNINIAYKIANRYRINYPKEYEDIKQVALLGLWKSIQHYDPKWALTTFAYKIIYNDINFYLRRINKHKNIISIHTIIKENDHGEATTIEDLIENKQDFIDDMLFTIDMQQTFNRINLNENDKIILKLVQQGLTQTQIGKKINRAQNAVSRSIKKIKDKFEKDYFK